MYLINNFFACFSFFFFFHFVHIQLSRNLKCHVMYCHHFVSVVVKFILLKYFDLLQNRQANWNQTMWECSLNGPPQSLSFFVLISNRMWPQLQKQDDPRCMKECKRGQCPNFFYFKYDRTQHDNESNNFLKN